ncbi:MAG: hypothetical protein KDB27_02780 [Planctomycetales bacterium]|nr:hypothetical protein [Planctomycetales bacterium]
MPIYKMIVASSLCLIAASDAFSQISTWSENAENGLANIVDSTSPSYPLIQSQVVSEGSNAFHLANPDFEDNWFRLTPTISVEATTQLFFTSQLGAATPEQVARVQLSTDGGTSWPHDIFAQPGSGFPGEGSFGLKTVPLSPFSGQEIQVRFLLDFEPPGGAFTQTDVGVGWLIDDIQIASEFQKVAYSIGEPSAEETLYLELINRSRADALEEGKRLAALNNPDVTAQLQAWSVDRSDIEAQYRWSVESGCFEQSAQPLAFNKDLLRMSELHSQDQLENGTQSHFSSNNPPAPFQPGDGLGERANRIGYPQNSFLSENVFSAAASVEHGHAGFEIDWGILNRAGNACYNADFDDQGMQNPAGHRTNIHDAVMKEAGIGVVPRAGGGHVVTQNFGSTGNSRFAAGVVYDDKNSNGFYDIGEGQGGVRVDSDTSPYYAVSTESGAYTLPISDDGPTTISFLQHDGTQRDVAVTFNGGQNQKVDHLIQVIQMLAGDFNANGSLDVEDVDLLSLQVRLGESNRAYDLNNDGLVDQSDRQIWVHDLKNVYFGDSDLNGEFNSGDFVLMFAQGQYEDGIAGNSTWATGDFNGDAEFDSGDFVFAFVDNGYEKGPRPLVAVPEPYPCCPFALIVVGLAAVVRVKRVIDPREIPTDA